MLRSLLILGSVAALLACGGGGDDDAGSDSSGDSGESASPGDEALEPSRELPSALGAPAAAGSGLDELPGDADRVPLEGFGEVAIAITDAEGDVLGWCVLLAETIEQRSRGLMEVEDLQGYDGMLFVWDADAASSFYMRNTPMPLSIAWFDADGALVSEADMEPCADVDDCPLYPADGPYRFALEVPQGELPELGITEGSTMRVGGDCAPRASPG